MKEQRLKRIFVGCLSGLMLAAPAITLSAAEPVFNARQLTKEQFHALPDGAIIDLNGGRVSAGELRARAVRHRQERKQRLAEMGEKLRARGEAARSSFLQKEKARLQQKNTLQQARLAGLLQQAAVVTAAPVVMTDPKIPPRITGLDESVEPGDYVSISGDHFGSSKGTVVVRGLPGGDMKLQAVDNHWTDTAIGVRLPDSISGVGDKLVSFQVVRKDGKASKEKHVPFIAARDYVYGVHAKLVRCGTDATENECGYFISFDAAHVEDTLWETSGHDMDTWEITLKNGWKIQTLDATNTNKEGQVGELNFSSPGVYSSHKWNMAWTVVGAGPYSGNMASYIGSIDIVGPRGVPYQ